MRIARVNYRLHETDNKWLGQNVESEFHAVDRELEIQSNEGIYFFSCREIDGVYVVACQHHSFFKPCGYVVRDCTEHAIWSPIIGREVEINRDGPDEVSFAFEAQGSECVYCSPFEDKAWGVDTLHISKKLPDYGYLVGQRLNGFW